MLEIYLAQFDPMQRGRVRAALERTQGFAGVYHKRAAYAEAIYRRPGVRIDWVRGRLYTDESDTFFAIGDVTKALADYLAWLQLNPRPLVATHGVETT